MKLAKKYSKLFLLASTFSLFVNTFIPLFYAFPVIAQDTTLEQHIVEEQKSEEPEVKQEESSDSSETVLEEDKTEEDKQEVEKTSEEEKVVKPTPTPVLVTPTPKMNVVATPTPTPAVDKQTKKEPAEDSEEKPAEEQIENESEPSININEPSYEEISSNKIKFTENAQIDVWYEYKDSGFKVKFTKLEGEAKLVIEEITLSDKQVENLGAVTNKAYDVYFDPKIENGNFEYELEYPVSESSTDVQVKYTEDKDGLEKGELTKVEQEVKVEGGSAKVDGLDHFTVFVVTKDTPASNGAVCINAATSTGSCYNTIQEAINNASSGDTIFIDDGVYQENLDIVGKANLTLKSYNGKANVTIKPSNNDYGFEITDSTGIVLDDISFEDNRSNNGFYLKVYKVDGLEILSSNFDGSGASTQSTGLDFNSSKNITIKDTVVTKFGKNGISFTSKYADNDPVTENILIEDVKVYNNNTSGTFWGGITFYITGGEGYYSDINGVEFKGTNEIYNNKNGIYIDGTKDQAVVAGVYGPGGSVLDLGNMLLYNNQSQYFPPDEPLSKNIRNWQLGDINALKVTFDGISNLTSNSGSDLDQVEKGIYHDCVDSPYIHGTCNPQLLGPTDNVTGDLPNVFGSVNYAKDLSKGSLNIKKLVCPGGVIVNNTSFKTNPNSSTINESQFRPTSTGIVMGVAFNDINEQMFNGCYFEDNFNFAVDHHPQDTSGAGAPSGPVNEIGTYTSNTSGDIVIADLSTVGRYEVREVDSQGNNLPDDKILGFACFREGQGGGNTTNAGEYAMFGDQQNNAYCIAFNLPEKGEIKGYKYIGEQDVPKKGVEINICPVDNYGESCNGDTQSTNTDGSGYYEFKDLTPGIYKVWETIVPGFEPMYPAGGIYYVEVLGGTSYKYLGNLVYNGSFENPVVTNSKKWDIYPDGTTGLGWKVEWNGGTTSFNNATRPTIANLELHRGVNSWSSDQGSQYAELDTDWDGPNGSLNNEPANVKITQRVPQCTDGTFDFSYAYSPRPKNSNNSVQVFWDGVLETKSGSGGNNVNWQTVNHTELVSTGVVGFAENGTGNALGMFVDDVVIEQNADCSDGFVNFYNKQTEIPKATINVNKYNDSNNDGKIDGESKIEDWGIIIHKISDDKLVEEFNVNSNDSNGEDTAAVLDSSKKYLVEVTGTWTNQNGARAVDADYYSDNSWGTVKDLDDDSSRDKRQLDLVIDNTDVNWASYSSSHLYKYVMAGTDSTVNFRIFDEDKDTNKPSWYNDNSGSLNVKIYDVTDEYYTTPVSVEVEPGEYQIVEELKPGWDQTYPSNPSFYHEEVVEGEEYNFDFANYQVPTTTSLQVCKVDESQTPLSGWKISLLGEKVDSVEVKPDSSTYSSSVLSNDNYVLVAHGSYEYRGNTGLITDPAYSERKPTDSVYSGPYVPFVNIMDLGTPGALGIMVNGSATNWSSYYNSSHTYHLGYPGYSGKFEFNVYDDNYSDNVGTMYVDIYKGYSGTTGENGCFTLQDVEYGNYEVSEVLMPDWENTSGLGNTEVNSETEQITVVNHKNVYDIHGFKFDDINADSEFDIEGESRLAGWVIFIDENGNKQLDEGETSTVTSDDEKDYGWYWFKGLPAGEYSICEVQKDGWNQTFPQDNACHTVTVPYDKNLEFSENEVYAPEYNFGNHFEEPELTIEKFNNVNNGAILSEKGGIVTYTLQVTANGNSVNNVVVTDLPPLGFTVQNPGTWQVTSNINGTFAVADPEYASPGDWKIGDMQAGETVTITYTAKIDENIDPGLYKDLAFAVGGNPRTEEDILAEAQPTGYIDTNYVGTSALIDEETPSPNADADIDEETEEEEIIVEEGDVLGASTSLPATGSPMWVITLAVILLASGISIVVYSNKKKSMKVLILPLALITMFTFTISGVNAAGLSVRVEDPKTPTNKGFDLSFVAMDISQRPVTAKCLVKKPGSLSFVQFEDSSLISGGTSHSCSVNTTVLTTDGSYEFKVEVTAGGDTAQDTTTVFYDGTNPGKPKDLNVDKKNSCKYEIDFKTADDGGQTSYVEIYRDDSTSFTVNASTRITTIAVGSNQKVEYTDNLAGSQCGSRQYYAVRAFDSAGNASDVLGEDIVEIKYVTTTTTSSSSISSSSTTGDASSDGGAIAVGTGGSVLGTGGANSENAQVIAEESENEDDKDKTSEDSENNQEEESGEVQGAFTKAISNKWVIIFSIFGLIGILALVLSYVKGRKTSS